MPATEHVPIAASPAVERTRLRVRVAAGSRRSEVVGRLGDAWKLRVRAAPARGRANGEVVELLAAQLGVTPAAVRVVAGHGSRDKVVEVDGLPTAAVERNLEHAGRHPS